jgi:hypothetical protein
MNSCYNKAPSERADDLKLTRCLCPTESPITCYRDYESYTRAKRARITKRCCPVQCVATADLSGGSYTQGTLLQLQGGETKNSNPALLQVFVDVSSNVTLNVYYAGQYTVLPTAPYTFTVYSGGTGTGGTLTVTWSNDCKSC